MQTLPEPICDLLAQLNAVVDPSHPKASMFIAASNEDADFDPPEDCYYAQRGEGVLITRHKDAAERFMAADLTDDGIGEILGYPQPKSEAVASGDVVAIQARDGSGHVITEAAISRSRLADALPMFARHAGPGGKVWIGSPVEALARREVLRRSDGAL